jgi:2-oxoglutarate ferredoxin oxidoreductase subunit beta
VVTIEEYAGLTPTWCPGCGNFGILTAIKKSLVEMELEPRDILLVSDIGQAGKLPHYMQGNVFNSLHGRAIPPALGAKIANPDLKVIVFSGDGGAYGEGGNHFIHTVRRNHDVTYIVHNNQVYALTKGQTSPTSETGFVTKTTPDGAPPPVNPLLLALAVGAGFVARGFAADTEHLAGLIKGGIKYHGFALIDVLQPCVSFNHKNTFAWYRERVYKLNESNHNPSDRNAAFTRAQEWGDKIPIGIIYREEKPAYEDGITALKKGALIDQPIEPGRVSALFDEFV